MLLLLERVNPPRHANLLLVKYRHSTGIWSNRLILQPGIKCANWLLADISIGKDISNYVPSTISREFNLKPFKVVLINQ